MIGKTLALAIRSIREDARLLRTHLFRLFLLLIILWFLVLTQWNEMGVGAPGLGFFKAVTILNVFFITLAGIGYFASAVTEEKEEMTLGLLRMAGIGPLALLAGKLLPRLVGALLLLAAQFPFTLLAITLGGVTLEQVAAAYCTLASYMLLLAGIALFCSVANRLTRTAAMATALIVGGLLFAPWWVLASLRAPLTGPIGSHAQSVLESLRDASPLYRIFEIMQTGFAGTAFGYQAISNSAGAAGFFLLSRLTFNWFNRDETAASPARGLLPRSSGRLRRLIGGRVWSNPFFWKDLHFIAGGPLAMLFKLLLYACVAAGLAASLPALSWNNRFDWEEYGGWTMTLALLLFLVEGALLACSVFQQEVQWKTLPSLWMLPTSMLYVAWSKIAGCLFGLLPVAAWFVFGALCAPRSFERAFGDLVDEPGFWFMATQYLLLLHLATLLSLFVRWLAFPLAIGIVFMTNFCCIGTMAQAGARGPDGPFVVMILLGGFAVIVLHVAIVERLRALAAQ